MPFVLKILQIQSDSDSVLLPRCIERRRGLAMRISVCLSVRPSVSEVCQSKQTDIAPYVASESETHKVEFPQQLACCS